MTVTLLVPPQLIIHFCLLHPMHPLRMLTAPSRESHSTRARLHPKLLFVSSTGEHFLRSLPEPVENANCNNTAQSGMQLDVVVTCKYICWVVTWQIACQSRPNVLGKRVSIQRLYIYGSQVAFLKRLVLGSFDPFAGQIPVLQLSRKV